MDIREAAREQDAVDQLQKLQGIVDVRQSRNGEYRSADLLARRAQILNRTAVKLHCELEQPHRGRNSHNRSDHHEPSRHTARQTRSRFSPRTLRTSLSE